MTSEHVEDDLPQYDATQMQYLKEECIYVDENDVPIGPISKLAAHRNLGKLHRAFSVFLFNKKHELLLQRRSVYKITFPLLKTNTCCSHPHYIPTEMNEPDGIKIAAMRKLDHELGLSPSTYTVDDLILLHKIKYAAPSCDFWSENEVDYVLFLQLEDPQFSINLNEVDMIEWVTLAQLDKMFQADEMQFTPWFRLIFKKKLLKEWWDLLVAGTLKDRQASEINIQVLS